MVLTRAELAMNLFRLLGMDKYEAKNLVEIFFEEICSLLEQG